MIDMLLSLAPQLIVSFGIVLTLLLIAWRRSQYAIAYFTLSILACSLLLSIAMLNNAPTQVTVLMKVDQYSAFAHILISLCGIVVVGLSPSFLKRTIEVHDEYYVLILLVVLGAGILVASDHFASLFLGFELLSISLVGLVGYHRESKFAIESGFKYLILSASASSFMLLGIAFLYATTGDLSFSQSTGGFILDSALYRNAGVLLFFSGVAFKLSLVPFHFWTPDIYQGAPTPVTLLLASISKVAMFIVLLKCVVAQHYFENLHLVTAFSFVAMLSMIIGNVLAIKQRNVKRLLAYSSIAHMGYLMIVVMISSNESVTFAWQSSLMYLSAYLLASISIFTVICLYERHLRKSTQSEKEMMLEDFSSLFWTNRPLALLTIVAILSFAGIPLTMGFIGKFYLISYATQGGMWGVLTTLIIGSGIALSYYLPIVYKLFKPISGDTPLIKLNIGEQAWLALLVSVGLLFGILPDLVSIYIRGY